MTRSGYSEDYDETFPNAGWFYDHNIKQATTGKRGQVFFRDLVAALDAMPVKRLIAEELVQDGEVCALGALGQARGINMAGVSPYHADVVAKLFKIGECLAREVAFQNDDRGTFFYHKEEESPEDRWKRMRDWAEQNIKPAA